MTTEGPLLETLIRRLAETPADFLAEPRIGAGSVNVAAVVADTLRDMGSGPLSKEALAKFLATDARKHRNRLSTVLLVCWLLHDPWFQGQPELVTAAYRYLTAGVESLAELVKAPQFVSDPDGREELVRASLNRLGLRPGESEAQAEDRLTTLNSAERQRVITAARQAEARARAIRAEMALKEAVEAADKASRE